MTQVRRQRSIEIVATITERCNLACTYFFFGGDEKWLRHSAVIKPEMIEALAGFLVRGPANWNWTTSTSACTAAIRC